MNGFRGDIATRTSRSASGSGNGRSSTPLTTANIATLAPMPSVSVMSAARVKAGDWRRLRTA
jgi:hypothetical protein